jgi:bifunctional non-homologous end joining protein LigD
VNHVASNPGSGTPLGALDDSARDCLERSGMPGHTAPMLATLSHEPFSSEDWIYERKLDGVRCLVYRDGRGARLRSRGDQRLDRTFPELADAVAGGTQRRVLADGEIVAFKGQVTSFSRLQKRIGIKDPEKAMNRHVAVYLYLFDILYLDGFDTTSLPLRSRKRLLRRTFEWGGRLRWTPHRNTDGEAWLEQACRKGWEGLIAKRAASVYAHKRSRDWLKFKCTAGQELVIGGYTDPQGSRKGFGALLVGYYEDGRLRPAGRVGTGFSDELLTELHERLQSLHRKTSPFDPAPEAARGVHWVTPKLVAEIGFTEWTDDGRLRHPRFLGLRPDKAAQDVVREDRDQAA